MSRRFYFLLIHLVSMVLLTGCWSQKELTELAIVTAFGLDKSEDGQYIGSFQIIIPSIVSGSVAGGGQEGSAGGAPFVVHTATGRTLTELSDEISKTVSRKQYFSHTGLVVIGEKLAAEEGLLDFLDTLDRDTDFRTTSSIVIAENTTAEKVISSLSTVDKISSENILKTIEFSEERRGESIEVTVHDLIKDLVTSGKMPVITAIRLIGDEKQIGKLESIQKTNPDITVKASGLAIIKDGKLTSYLHGETSRGAVWIMDKITDTSILIGWKGHKEAISYRVIRQRTDVSAQLTDKTPSISVQVRAEGDIGGLTVPVNLNDPHELHKIERKLEEEIRENLEKTIQTMQTEKADIFGFGEVIHRSYPKVWKELRNDWHNNHFPELKVNVTVDTYVRRSGLRSKSFLNEIENNR